MKFIVIGYKDNYVYCILPHMIPIPKDLQNELTNKFDNCRFGAQYSSGNIYEIKISLDDYIKFKLMYDVVDVIEGG